MAYPILAPNSTWYDQGGTTVLRSTITEINIVDSYTPADASAVTSSWDASAALDGSIMAYVEGTKLTIAGNGSGKIAMNEDSSYLFCYNDDENTGDNYFVVCTAIKGIDLFDSSNVKSLFGAFGFCLGLTELDLSSWDVSNVENMQSMFFASTSNPTALDSLNLSGWNVTNKLTTTKKMFNGCSSLTTVDVSNWDVSNVTDMSGMFNYCNALTALDVAKWNTASLTTMRSIFQYCSKLTSLDVSNWDVSNVTDMGWAFYFVTNGCGFEVPWDLSKWDVSKVEIFHHCFAYASNIRFIGYEKWNVGNVKTMNCMFGFNYRMTTYNLSEWNVSNVESFAQMFDGNDNLIEIKGLENWDTSSGKNFYEMFYGCHSLKELNLSSFDTRNANDNWIDPQRDTAAKAMTLMFGPQPNSDNFDNEGLHGLEKVVLGPNFSFTGDGTCIPAVFPAHTSEYTPNSDGYWYTEDGTAYDPSDIPNLTAAAYYYINPIWLREFIVKGESILAITDLLREKTGKTQRMIFPRDVVSEIEDFTNQLAYVLGQIKVEHRDLNGLFDSNGSLVTAPFFDTSGFINAVRMFYGCGKLVSVPLYDFSSMTSLNSMFSGCIKLTTVPCFDTRNVSGFNQMFYGCSSLPTIPELDVRKASNINNMVNGCTSLRECWIRNIKISFQVGSGSSYGHLLTVESLVHLIQELINTGQVQKLTIGNINLEKLANIYVRTIEVTDDMRAKDEFIDGKVPFEVCESTDENAVLITNYAVAKNWTIV